MKRILVVEDDPRDLELTLFAMEEARLANDVDSVRDGAEALDYLFRKGRYADRPMGNPALVLLDFTLPKISGLEVLQAIRGTHETALIPVVIFTSSREERDMIRSYEMRTSGYVVKPLDFDKFLHAIRDIGGFWAVLNEPPPGSLRKPSQS